MRVLLAGFGRVGRSFAIQVLERRERIRAEYGVDVNLAGIAGSDVTWLPDRRTDPDELHRAMVQNRPLSDIPGRHRPWNAAGAIENVMAGALVEATSGDIETGEPGTTNVRSALAQGLHVVAASKGAFVWHYRELRQEARRQGLQLRIGAATGAALPALALARYGLAGANITSVEGILNGTSNYILTRMAVEESSFGEALKSAQMLGVAEADPRLDVEGIDTATKLVLLANALLDAELTLDDVSVEGVTTVTEHELRAAASRGEVIRLVGCLVREGEGAGWRASVRRRALAPDHPLAGVAGLDKGISYVTDTMDRVTVIGGRSDPNGAAAAVLRDLINIGRSR